MQKPFEKPVEREIYYSITETEPEEQATYLSVNTVVGDDLDPIHYMAFQILEYAADRRARSAAEGRTG